ncbi:MAG: transglutaminase domain-containing protein [Nitrospirae bacterium]|nr:transglutaminase domain-containing protein [Nitrospirota bacterium]
MKLRVWTLLKVLILVVWALQLVELQRKSRSPLLPPAEILDLDAFAAEPPAETWMGVYYQGKKIGYTNAVWSAEEDGYRVVERALLSPKIMGEAKEIKTATHARVGPDYSLRSLEFKMESGPVDFFLTGTVEGHRLKLTVRSGGRDSNHEIELQETPRLAAAVQRIAAQKKLQPGARYRMPIFDPSVMANQELVVEVGGRERVAVGREVVDAYKLHQVMGSVESWTWVTPEGETVKEESPMGFTLLRETAEQALSEGWPTEQVDLIASTAIPVEEFIADPTALSLISLRLRGAPIRSLSGLTERQEVSGEVVTIRKESGLETLKGRLPVPVDKGLKAFLEPEVLIPTEDPRLAAVARTALGTETGALAGARRLTSFVYSYLEKVPTVSIPDALQVLESRRGDCNEHAVLFAALARVVGLPAKVAVGLVYNGGSFYYHAWNEVYVPGAGGRGRWIAVDSALNQVPADVTHLKMAEGGLENQIQIMTYVGHLRIDILRTVK